METTDIAREGLQRDDEGARIRVSSSNHGSDHCNSEPLHSRCCCRSSSLRHSVEVGADPAESATTRRLVLVVSADAQA